MGIQASGGVHWLYRAPDGQGNTKLAERLDRADPSKREVLIETRGVGGFIVIAPSHGKVHPSGDAYKLVLGGLNTIVALTASEHDDLWGLARAFDEKPEIVEVARPAPPNGRRNGTNGHQDAVVRPGDDFADRASWDEILEPHGWTKAFSRGDTQYWRRPGKDHGVSATTGHCKGLKVFSSSTAFSTDGTHSKLYAHALLNHGGDVGAATKALVQAGYGRWTDEGGEERPNPLLKPTRREKTAGSAGKPKVTPELDAQLAKHPRTDLGNGERMVARFGADLRYCHPWKKWLHFDRQRWKEDDTAAVRRLAKRTVREILNEAATVEDDEERKAHNKWWNASEGKAKVEAMISLASSENGIPILPDDLDRDRSLLTVENGTIDLRTGKLRPHQREDLITRLAPVKFVPGAACPTWLRVLDDVFARDPGLIRFLKMLCGVCLTGDISNQILPVLYGSGANGKTTILTVLLEILGPDYAIVAPPGLLTLKKSERHPTELACLFNKRLVVDSETAEGAQFNENLVKQLTGGDRIRARRMREDFWEFSPTHKILMCTNHKPEIRETKNAIWRRVKLVPFNVAIPEDRQDARLPERLRAEYSGILTWCVEGCLEWQESGLEIPDAVESATKEYRAESDLLAQFLASECSVISNLTARATPLYARYQKWAGDEAVNQRRFGKALSERGFKKHTNNGIVYEGIGLRSEPEQERSW
jgi:putative DNA primase/helicase